MPHKIRHAGNGIRGDDRRFISIGYGIFILAGFARQPYAQGLSAFNHIPFFRRIVRIMVLDRILFLRPQNGQPAAPFARIVNANLGLCLIHPGLARLFAFFIIVYDDHIRVLSGRIDESPL